MYPLNDKDLDRLSRDAAEHYDVESSASGWERLEKRLDKELPVKEKNRRRFLFWLFLIALVSGGSLVYMLGGAPGDRNLAGSAPEAGNVGEASAPAARNADGNAGSVAQSKKKSTATLPDDNTVTENNIADKIAPKQTPGANSTITPSEQTNTVAKNKTALPDNSKLSADKANAYPKKDLIAKKASGKPSLIESNNRRVNDAVIAGNDRAQRSEKPISDKSVAKNDQQVVDDIVPVTDSQKTDVAAAETKKETESVQKTDSVNNPPAAQTVAKKPETKKQNTPVSRWEFGVVTGPDFNNVGFKETYKAGLNIGAYIGFRISDRLLVNTGLIYTKKWYKVAGEDFYPPKHTWISYQDVDHVTGSCNMFEVPVNIRYDITNNKKGRFFASTGVSGYIMDKQNYDCVYNDAGTMTKWNWNTDSNYNYIFSNLNLSFGYERALGRNFSIQAEPYLKLPLRGLGYGGLKMNSYGMFVTFKYKPSARTKK